MTIRDYLLQEKNQTLPLVEAFLDDSIDRYSHLGPSYISLLTHLHEHLLRGGKWHRPALALLGYRLAGGVELDAIRKNAAALELFHRYLLIHDDILDQDLVRHGGPTMEQIYAEYFSTNYPSRTDLMFSKGMAIVSGDVVNALAYELLTAELTDPLVIRNLVSGCNQLLLETCAGWQLQTEQNFKPLGMVSEDDCVGAMTLVSAYYSVVWPLRIGQILAGKQSQWNLALDAYGVHAGIAFQITDDILGMFGEEIKTGKPVGHDYREGKKSLLLIKAFERATQVQKDFLLHTLGTEVTEADIRKAQDIIIKTGALESVQQLAQEHVSSALHQLESVKNLDIEAVNLLSELALLFVDRDH